MNAVGTQLQLRPSAAPALPAGEATQNSNRQTTVRPVGRRPIALRAAPPHPALPVHGEGARQRGGVARVLPPASSPHDASLPVQPSPLENAEAARSGVRS